MNDHADDRGAPQRAANADEPVAATRREQRERDERGLGDAPLGDAPPQDAAAHSATTDHDVIRQWAEDRHATPATVEGTEHDGAVGELRLDFDFGNDLENLTTVSWEQWFAAFDERGLEFVYQDGTRADGSASNDFRLETAGQTRL